MNMGTFFDDLGERIAQTAGIVTNKANDVVEITRIRNLSRNLKQKNQQDLIELGKIIFRKYQDKEELDPKMAALCEAIEDRDKSIAKYQQQISDVKGEHLCQECGRYSSKDTAFCPYCGKPFEDEKKDEKEEDDAKDVLYAEDIDFEVEETVEEIKEKAEDLKEQAKEKAADMAVKAKDKIVETAENVCDKVTEKLDDQEAILSY